jgi:Spy/CpxP family protein refolding chaperone
MKLATASMVAFLVSSLLVVSGAMAAQDDAAKAEKKAKKGKKGDPTAQFYEVPKEVTLSEEQNKSLAKIKEDYKTKVDEAIKARNELLTKEQQKAMADARKAAQAEGKKGKELQAAVKAAAGLDADKQAKLDELNKKTTDLKKEINGKILALLTPEQKAKVEESKKKEKTKA